MSYFISHSIMLICGCSLPWHCIHKWWTMRLGKSIIMELVSFPAAFRTCLPSCSVHHTPGPQVTNVFFDNCNRCEVIWSWWIWRTMMPWWTMDISYFAHRPEHCLLEADTSTLRLANTSFFNDWSLIIRADIIIVVARDEWEWKNFRLVDFGDAQTVKKGVEGMNMSTQSHPGLPLFIFVPPLYLQCIYVELQDQ